MYGREPRARSTPWEEMRRSCDTLHSVLTWYEDTRRIGASLPDGLCLRAVRCRTETFSSSLDGRSVEYRGPACCIGQRGKAAAVADAREHRILLLRVFSFAVDDCVGPIQSPAAALLLLLFRF